MNAPADRFDSQPNVSNHFAWLRTVMGLQRTLMAAVRTSISLIGFGFTVAQFFEKIKRNLPEGVRDLGEEVPRNLGLSLIAAGVVSLAVFTWQYRAAMRYMHSEPFHAIAKEKPMHTSVYLLAVIVILIGVTAFLSIVIRF
jgi:putative membrane protein